MTFQRTREEEPRFGAQEERVDDLQVGGDAAPAHGRPGVVELDTLLVADAESLNWLERVLERRC